MADNAMDVLERAYMFDRDWEVCGARLVTPR